jgi:hypothetical protein
VHTSAFRLSQAETRFYEALLDYLRDGYNLPEASGNKGRALGFLADARVKFLRKFGEKIETEMDDEESHTSADEESAAMLVSVALPAERQRIRDLLKLIPHRPA